MKKICSLSLFALKRNYIFPVFIQYSAYIDFYFQGVSALALPHGVGTLHLVSFMHYFMLVVFFLQKINLVLKTMHRLIFSLHTLSLLFIYLIIFYRDPLIWFRTDKRSPVTWTWFQRYVMPQLALQLYIYTHIIFYYTSYFFKERLQGDIDLNLLEEVR